MRLQRMHQIWTVLKSSIKWIEELKKENKELNKKEAVGSNVSISNLPGSKLVLGQLCNLTRILITVYKCQNK